MADVGARKAWLQEEIKWTIACTAVVNSMIVLVLNHFFFGGVVTYYVVYSVLVVSCPMPCS